RKATMGVQVDFRYPLRSCPGRARWERRRGNNYLVFVDESTNRFFNLDSHYGFFCHAAVGIPEPEYPQVVERLGPVFEQYRKIVGPRETEFKHREFRRIPHAERFALATQIAGVLRDSGGFVSGFYTPTESFILERVRWNRRRIRSRSRGTRRYLPSCCGGTS